MAGLRPGRALAKGGRLGLKVHGVYTALKPLIPVWMVLTAAAFARDVQPVEDGLRTERPRVLNSSAVGCSDDVDLPAFVPRSAGSQREGRRRGRTRDHAGIAALERERRDAPRIGRRHRLMRLERDPRRVPRSHDVVIYGGTSAGVVAAVQAKRMGKSVVIVSPDKHLGGLTAGGLGFTDTGNKSVIGGIAREFYHRVWRHYQEPVAWKWEKREQFGNRGQGTPAIDGERRTMWVFEPHVAEAVFEALVAENEIEVVRDEWLDRDKGVEKRDGRILAISTLGGRTFAGKIFVDATYEGDLMAAAGVSYFVGRESNSRYGETLNGVQIENARKHQFHVPIDPYVVPGDPSSGLLPRIHGGDPGRQGEGDHRLQAYNYRVCLTAVPENRVPFPRPKGYDSRQYELLLRTLLAGIWYRGGTFDLVPNKKTDTNNHGPFSTDNIGGSDDYPQASYARRREILEEHETYQKGYFFFLANDPRVPGKQREWMARWGLARDEFRDNGHWPHQIYVREARRMVSDFVVTENHVRGKKPTPRPIGMGSYNMDSHNTQRYVDASGHVRNEGDVQVRLDGPYPIDLGAIITRRHEVENLLVPVCISASHIAYGSIRMEPVFMILGQSAATVASLAIDAESAVQDVSYDGLRERLLGDGQVLEYASERATTISRAKLEGIVVDDAQLRGGKDCIERRSVSPFVGNGYRHDDNDRKGRLVARFETGRLRSGIYEVRVSYTSHPNRATDVAVTVTHAGGDFATKLNQRRDPPIGGLFRSLGKFRFEKGRKATVVISNRGTDGYVIIDAVQWLPVEGP